MTLKYAVDNLDGVDEAMRGLYAERDGKFVLAVEGAVPKDKLDEFRNTNIELRRQMDELTAKFSGIDPDAARQLAEKAAKERDKKLIDAGKVDDLVAERVNAMKTDYEKSLAALSGERDSLTKQLETLLIDTAIRDAATKSGVRNTAVEDVLLRGRSLFRLHEGKATPMDGDKPVFGKTGDPMSIDEWVSGLADNAPHLFEPSQGSGARASVGNTASAGRIARTDGGAFLRNLDAIAKGTMKVV